MSSHIDMKLHKTKDAVLKSVKEKYSPTELPCLNEHMLLTWSHTGQKEVGCFSSAGANELSKHSRRPHDALRTVPKYRKLRPQKIRRVGEKG